VCVWGWVPDWEAGTEAAAARYRAGTGVAVAVAGSRRVAVRHCLLTTDASTALCRHSSQPPPPPAAAAAGRHGNRAASSSSSSAGCHAGRGTAAGRHGQRGGGDRQQLEKRGQSLRLRRTKASHQHQQLSITHGHAHTHTHARTHTHTHTRTQRHARWLAAENQLRPIYRIFSRRSHDYLTTGNESAPIQLFPGLAISNDKILTYFSNKIHGSNLIKQHSEPVMV